MRFFEEMNGFANGGFAFDALVSRHAAGQELGVLLRGGAGEIEFVANLNGEIGSAGESGEKYIKYGYSYKFHKSCQSRGNARAGVSPENLFHDLNKIRVFLSCRPADRSLEFEP